MVFEGDPKTSMDVNQPNFTWQVIYTDEEIRRLKKGSTRLVSTSVSCELGALPFVMVNAKRLDCCI